MVLDKILGDGKASRKELDHWLQIVDGSYTPILEERARVG